MFVFIGALAVGAAIGAALTSGSRKASASNPPVEEFDAAPGKEIIDFGFTGIGNPSPESLDHQSPKPATQGKDGYWQNSARAWVKELWIKIKPAAQTFGSWVVRNRDILLSIAVALATSLLPNAGITSRIKALQGSGIFKIAFV